MKKPVLITIFILFLSVAGYFSYQHFFNKPKITLWDLVPAETVLVYETSDCKECLQQLKNSPVAEIVRAASSVTLDSDSLSPIHDLILSFQQPTLVSLHVTKKDEFDFTFYTQGTPAFDQKLNAVLTSMATLKGLKVTQREFQTVPIQELSYRGKTFSSVRIQNVWVGSYSPILVEDVIRTYTSEQESSFRDVISSVYQLPRIKNDAGNLYLHLNNLSRWFSIFTSGSSGYLIDHFGHSALLDAKVAGNRLELNGFSYHPLNRRDFFLSAFQDQAPVELKSRNLISNRTLLVNTFGISDGSRFFPRLNELSKNPHLDTLKVIAAQFGDLQPLLNGLQGELSLCQMESRKDELARILLLNDAANAGKWFDFFQTISTEMATDSLFIDRYASYEIFEMALFNLPEKLFYPLVTGFNTSYYTRVGSTLCIADNIDELKKFLDDIDNENTWGKSVAQNKFLESTLLESSVSIFVNTPRIWHLLGLNLQPRWQKFLEDNKPALSRLGMGSIQFSHLNDTYYTNVSWALSDAKQGAKPAPSDRYITNFAAGIARMNVTRNHNDNSREILVQDSAKNLALLSPEGKILWQVPLPDLIMGDVHQVDYFSNGKIQYFFATPGNLHIIDRLGNYVKPFPVPIKEKEIDFVSVIDYDHSRKYRFMVASTSGKLWMFDKDGNNLEGWQPRTVDEKLITSVNHHRILGKDYLLAIRRDGLVFLMNRRGELLKNFPLDLETRLAGDYFLEPGKRTSDTYFTVVSEDGTKYRFNLQGKVDLRDALVKNSPDARFSLVAEKQLRSYLILRREAKLFTVFDENGNAIISSDYIGNNPVNVDFYSFGNGRDYIVVTDLSQELSFIYDRKGKLITPIPLDSRILKIYPSEGDKLNLYFADQRNVTIATAP